MADPTIEAILNCVAYDPHLSEYSGQSLSEWAVARTTMMGSLVRSGETRNLLMTGRSALVECAAALDEVCTSLTHYVSHIVDTMDAWDSEYARWVEECVW